MSIIIENLCKSYGSNKVLRDVNIKLEDGKIYCLMGMSGMGKTTLLRILMGHESYDSGSIKGIDTSLISTMFQEDRLIPTLSAVENVAIVSSGRAKKKDIRKNLSLILPEECLDNPVTSLSGGMKRRVALARAMAYSSELIILDEPFTGLDKDTRLAIIDYILKMREKRIMLIATHQPTDRTMPRILGQMSYSLQNVRKIMCQIMRQGKKRRS